MRCSKAALFVLEFLVFFAEAFDSARRIDKLLFAGEKRMTLGTYFNPNVLFGGAGFDHVSAGALNGCLMIIRMNVRFHDAILSPCFAFRYS